MPHVNLHCPRDECQAPIEIEIITDPGQVKHGVPIRELDMEWEIPESCTADHPFTEAESGQLDKWVRRVIEEQIRAAEYRQILRSNRRL